jgi:hypothetical protein
MYRDTLYIRLHTDIFVFLLFCVCWKKYCEHVCILTNRKDISGFMVRNVGKNVHNYSGYAFVVKTPEEKQFKGRTKY